MGTVKFIIKAFLASWALLCLLYPDLFVSQDRRLLISHESEIPFESTYILVSHFFHGGIQLWDRYDQVNNAFYVCTNGVYGVVNVLTAFIFVLLSPLFSHPGEALYHTHIFVFYGLTCLLRTIGGYLLLRKFTCEEPVIFIGILYLNTVLTSYMMTPGLEQQGVYSYFPLLLYLILQFFEEVRLRAFLLVAMVMCLAFTSSPYFTLGYFYQAAHFFVLSALVFFIWQRRWRLLRERPALPREELYKNIGLAFCCLLILLPYYFWSHALTHDFYVHGSGLGGTQGRFNNVFNFKGYFNLFNKGFANSYEFFGTALDYHHNVWGITWAFIGATFLGLVLAGLVLSKDSRKYIFAGGVLGVMLINNAWFPGNFTYLNEAIKYVNLGDLFWARGMQANNWISTGILMLSTLAHAINALTNPFCFLVRSFHMSSVLMPVLLLPLMVMGLQSCIFLWQGRHEPIYFNRRRVLALLYGLIFIWALLGGTKGLTVGLLEDHEAAETLKLYILSVSAVFFVLIACSSVFKGKFRERMPWIILGLAFAIDFTALMVYVPGYDRAFPDKTSPVRLSPVYTNQAVVPDFQNPKILPLREYINVVSAPVTPTITGGMLCMYGAFYQFTPIGRFFHPWSIYEGRHLSYRDLYPDRDTQQYLASNPRTIFFADSSGRWGTGGQPAVWHAGLDWPKAREQRTRWGWQYTFDLPKDFPGYLSTTIFTADIADWRLTLDGRTLQPMQGMLTTPFTFDVQNIQENKLTVLMPDERPVESVELWVKLPDHITQVWKNTYDDLGLTYTAPQDGWVVFHDPYDPKWELTVDGHKTALTRVNRYFMAAQITRGEHKLLLRYWPHTPLRGLIFISMLLSCICFIGLIFYSIKRLPLCRG